MVAPPADGGWTGWLDPDSNAPGLSPYLAWRRFRDRVPDADLSSDRARDTARQAAQDFACACLGGASGLLDRRFGDAVVAGRDWLPDPVLLPVVAPDTVIVGVIDTGIALGNNRFRTATGHSRVLASWQMTPSARHAPMGVPYGRVLLHDEIEARLAAASGGSLAGHLDEGAFNAAAGLCDLTDPLAPHDLAGIAAHGTATLDLAAGCPPGEPGDFARRVQIITVTLPHRRIFGEAGELLDLFMLHAVQWIADIADAIWRKSCPQGAQSGGVRGFPMAINLSFGRQAGAKDGRIDLFPQALARIRAARDGTATAQGAAASALEIVMPAGNDNLAWVHAEHLLAPGETREIGWRIPPGDRTDNFLELWARGSGQLDAGGLDLALTPPGGVPAPLPLDPGRLRNMGRAARIHCRASEAWQTPGADDTVGVLMCLAATDAPDWPGDTALAGLWMVSLRNTGPQPVRVHLSVQTDQGVRAFSPSAVRSYLHDPDYRRHDDQGRWADALMYGPGAWRDMDNPQGVRRHGTINASAAQDEVVCVGGFRRSDGQPAPYSAAGSGVVGIGLPGPTACLPTDDSPALPGLLMAGSANGSVVALRGTSFAAAQATRLLAARHLTGASATNGADHLSALAAFFEAQASFAPPHVTDPALGQTSTAKLGAGRIAAHARDRPDRRA